MAGYGNQSIICANTDNAQILKSSPGALGFLICFNVNASPRWVKLYDKATTPDSTDTPVLRLAVPGATSNAAGFVAVAPPRGFEFANGIGIRIVTEQADNGTTAPSAGDVVVNYSLWS